MKQGFFRIAENVPLTDSVLRMRLEGDTSAVTGPGQFVNIKLDGKFLRRPISVCDCEEGVLTLLYKVVGSGTLRLDRTGLRYTGTRDGQPFSFHIESHALPTYGMCTDLSRFYTFLNGEFLEFYPEHRVVEKFFLATEELHRLNGGKWKAFCTQETAAV